MAITRLNNNSITSITALPSAVAVANTPCFRAAADQHQSISNTTQTVIVFDYEFFDVGGCYNHTGSSTTLNGITTPAYSFAPNVAGTYYCKASTRIQDEADWDANEIKILKNGSAEVIRESGPNRYVNTLSCMALVELNGTSDYIHVQFYHNRGGAIQITGDVNKQLTVFEAFKIIE